MILTLLRGGELDIPVSELGLYKVGRIHHAIPNSIRNCGILPGFSHQNRYRQKSKPPLSTRPHVHFPSSYSRPQFPSRRKFSDARFCLGRLPTENHLNKALHPITRTALMRRAHGTQSQGHMCVIAELSSSFERVRYESGLKIRGSFVAKATGNCVRFGPYDHSFSIYHRHT
jgi:hypothetical protein